MRPKRFVRVGVGVAHDLATLTKTDVKKLLRLHLTAAGDLSFGFRLALV